ncbi:MAG TPA: hypothetical protein VMV69_23255 [Pirellulales bacterium]|nr:hypothetical protein [Pirellulales bacterium]
MSKSQAYRSTDVKNVVLDEVLSQAALGRVTVGTDIGKFSIFAVLRFSDGTFRHDGACPRRALIDS